MRIDDPSVLAQVQSAFDAYEQALVGNDVAMLDRLFWNDPRTLRYGATENLVGYDAIQQFRAARPARGLQREIVTRHITSFGDDFAVASISFRRLGQARIGRQTQSWVRRPEGWRVVAAHVSWMDA